MDVISINTYNFINNMLEKLLYNLQEVAIN